MSWREFWNQPHSIYVNERHRLLHYDRIAKDIAALIPSRQAAMLDYGCGEATSASDAARQCGHLYLFDTAPSVQNKLRQRLASEPNISVLNDDGFLGLPDASLDIVICNSVLQYLRADETGRLVEIWHDKLKPAGRLVLGDIIQPDLGPLGDVKALLHFAWQGGFLIAALRGLAATFFSNYRTLRNEIGLTTYSEEDMLSLLSASGFTAKRADHNIGHNQLRMTFIATKT